MNQVIKVSIDQPKGEDHHGYPRFDTLAELKLEVSPEAAWAVYQHAVMFLTRSTAEAQIEVREA